MTSFNDSTQVATVDAAGGVTWDRPADRLRNAAEAQYERIRGNGGLTQPARVALIADVFTKLQASMDELKARTGVTTAADIAGIKRRLFGIDDLIGQASAASAATMQVSFRDAQDRAAQLDNEAEALALLERANETGDELLARAIGNACLTGGPFGSAFGEVAEAYLADRPEKAAAYEELVAARQPLNIADMWQYVVPAPVELNGMNAAQVAAAAAEAAGVRNALQGLS